MASRLLRRSLATQSSVVPSYQLFINGQEVEALAKGTIRIESPATREHVATVAEGRKEDVDVAVAAAKQAFDDGRWAHQHASQRAHVLNKAAEILRARLPELAKIETEGTGRCLREYNAQLGRIPEWLTYHAALAQTMEGRFPPFSDRDHSCTVERLPIGVCGLITPWNHPLLIATKKVSVALATGNSIVVKPPEQAPVSVIELAKIMKEAGLPDGVMNVVPGYGGEAGSALVGHQDVHKIDFTGGTATGQAIGKIAGPQVKHYCAELGGNCPVIVFDDCDMEEAINGVAFGAFVASGQTCVSAKRIIIHESIFDEFVQRLVNKANGLKLGDPMDLTTHMGPLVSQRQLDILEGQVKAGYEEGAVALAGGKRPSKERCELQQGYFFEPTILGSVKPHMSVFQEELFGPVVSVSSFKDEAEALRLANDSKYGLGGAVWTQDVKRAHRMARDLHAGVMWVNAHHRNDPSAPWGGFKESGIGRENGVDSFLEYTQAKTVVIRMSDAKENWFGGRVCSVQLGE